jgi:hypothetical protein
LKGEQINVQNHPPNGGIVDLHVRHSKFHELQIFPDNSEKGTMARTPSLSCEKITQSHIQAGKRQHEEQFGHAEGLREEGGKA